jgi:hypothetical protein
MSSYLLDTTLELEPGRGYAGKSYFGTSISPEAMPSATCPSRDSRRV